MNLLVLSPWFPYPPDNGSRLRAFHLIRELAARGHRLRLVTGLQEDAAKTLRESGEEVPPVLREMCDEVVVVPWQWPSEGGGIREMARSLLSAAPRSIMEADNPALVATIREQAQKPTDVVLGMELGIHPYIPGGLPFPVALDQVEVSGMERAFRDAPDVKARLRHGLTYRKGVRYWRGALRRYDFLTAVSEDEAAAVRRVLGSSGDDAPPVHVIPNGVDVRAFDNASGYIRAPVPGRIIYNGALTYRPNRDAVHWFAREILPVITARVPEAHLVVTGRYEAASAGELKGNPRVRLTGFLPDLQTALAEAAVCAVPLLAGGGTRLKILEAWAAGVPVVSTTIGAAGLCGEDGVHLLRADTAQGLGDAVTRLLREPETARALAQNARRLVEREYDWPAIAARLSDLLETAAARRTTAK